MDKVLVLDDFGPDEAAFEVGVDDTGGAGGLVSGDDGPGAAFVGPGGEEGPQAEQFVGTLDEAHDAAFFQAHFFQEHLAVFVFLDLGDFGLRTGGYHQDFGIFGGDGGADGVHISVAGGGRRFVYVANVQNGLVREQIQVFGHLLLLGVFEGYRAAGKAFQQGFTVTEQQLQEFLGFFVAARRGLFLHFLDAVFHRFQVFDLEFGVHHFFVADRVYRSVYVDDVAVVKAAQHVQDGVGLADVREELVSQALSLGGTFHQAGDVHDLHGGGDGALGLADFGKHFEALVGHVGGADVRVDGAEGEVGALGFSGADTVK